MLVGEGQYNLNVIKDIKVTESFLGLDQEYENCQNVEPLEDCTTRQYVNTYLNMCGCLPFRMLKSNKVA